MTDLKALIERLWELDGPDRAVDHGIHACTNPPLRDGLRYGSVPKYTASTDAAEALVKRVLPGWCYKMGTCCVSDDAWVAPDHNCPVHGKRLREEYGEPVFNSVFDAGVDIDRRPPGSIAIALCIAILTALVAVEEKKASAA